MDLCPLGHSDWPGFCHVTQGAPRGLNLRPVQRLGARLFLVVLSSQSASPCHWEDLPGNKTEKERHRGTYPGSLETPGSPAGI